MKFWKLVSTAIALILSTSVNAVVINTLNGIEYEWLELIETAGLSRDQVEVRLADRSDSLFGYEYASRSLVSSLLYSYSTWDGRNGYHVGNAEVLGVTSLLRDFNVLEILPIDGVSNSWARDIDGNQVNYDGYSLTNGLYGESGECGVASSCRFHTITFQNNTGTDIMIWQNGSFGWDQSVTQALTSNVNSYSSFGSFLVKPSVVPLPAAVWLFGSGLIGLIGIAKKKSRV